MPVAVPAPNCCFFRPPSDYFRLWPADGPGQMPPPPRHGKTPRSSNRSVAPRGHGTSFARSKRHHGPLSADRHIEGLPTHVRPNNGVRHHAFMLWNEQARAGTAACPEANGSRQTLTHVIMAPSAPNQTVSARCAFLAIPSFRRRGAAASAGPAQDVA